MRFLFVDRIVHLSPGKVIRGLKHITQDDYYLCPNEQGTLCFIPSLIGEALGQLAAWNVMVSQDFMRRPVAGVVSRAELLRLACVGETLLLESFIDHLDDSVVQYHSVAFVGDEPVFRIEGALGPLLPMDAFIDKDIARGQFNEIHRLGDWIEPHSVMNEPLLTLAPAAPARSAPMVFDRIIASEPGVRLVAEKRITRMASYFPDHFPNKPVLPMTVLLECKLNLAREFVRRMSSPISYRVSELRKIKMNDFVYPGDVVMCTVTLKRHEEDELMLSYRSEVDGKRVCVLNIVMKPVELCSESRT